MSDTPETRFRNLLHADPDPQGAPPALTPAHAAKLLARTENVPFFAHSYALYHNMIHGTTPADLVRFAYENDLHGVCLHISDGEAACVRKMPGKEREALRRLREELGIALHLEISSTDKAEVDTVVLCARDLGVHNIRVYARHEGPLSRVIELVYADMAYISEQANKFDLNVDYEQHEDLRAAEIAGILQRLGDPRMNALFDYSNSYNAYEEPLEALHILAPYIRQVHIKGARKTIEPNGWGQIGVPQGAAEDELPGARMLHDLLMLGDGARQVIAFALEQEVDYYAPAFRGPNEVADPIIQYREPSETPVDRSKSTARLLADERRWALQQIAWNRGLVAQFRELAGQVARDRRGPDVPAVFHLPAASYSRFAEMRA
jgi:sugar phosphate isomerase/epimerase